MRLESLHGLAFNCLHAAHVICVMPTDGIKAPHCVGLEDMDYLRFFRAFWDSPATWWVSLIWGVGPKETMRNCGTIHFDGGSAR